MMTRRNFIQTAGLGVAAIGTSSLMPNILTGFSGSVSADAKTKTSSKVLVCLFQRGAADGLNIVVPFTERSYYDLRPTLAIPEPKSGNPKAAINLDGKFGFHPTLAPLKPYFDKGQLAVIHAAGSPDATRSHFDAQDYMESGTPGRKSTTDGWLNRYLAASVEPGDTPFRGVALTQLTPRSMQGAADVVAMANIGSFNLRAGSNSSVKSSFEEMYAQSATDALRGTGHDTFDAVNFLRKANPEQFKVENGADYPRGELGNSLRQIAQLIKADVGLEVAFAEMGGWDTHNNQGDPGNGQGVGRLSRLLRDFGGSLAAFAQDLGPRMQDVVVLTMTEFGRTARQNGTGGTDHGHASCMFVLGGPVKGGKVYGQWPGLGANDLYEGRDLAVTTDFRDVVAEVLTRHMGAHNLRSVLPGYTVNEKNFRGLL